MSISSFDIFTVGIGPSSSHTVGPMKAAKLFIQELIKSKKFDDMHGVRCDFYGSLALTGKGHGTDKAFILGIQGFSPETIDSDKIPDILANVKKQKKLILEFNELKKEIKFNIKDGIKFNRRITLPHHPNGMTFTALDNSEGALYKKTYFSIGGGFVVSEDEIDNENIINNKKKTEIFPFQSGKELISLCEKHKMSISELIMENEKTWRTEKEIIFGMMNFWNVMESCISRGIKNEGILPGGLKVKRRAPEVYKKLASNPERNLTDMLSILDWVNLYALAVNEENAAGGQVVTAPTNGAAGIIPAVLMYYVKFCPQADEKGIIKFLLTAAAIGRLYKENASISGAEVGCQGEVGVACSMAAGALCEVLGGSIYQVENAAEIAMEHNLGLTCDPIGGLVQIPCIERNAMGSVKAINAARIALQGDGSHHVSLDKVIATMRQTGLDMKKQYKETSRGGLAVNIPEC